MDPAEDTSSMLKFPKVCAEAIEECQQHSKKEGKSAYPGKFLNINLATNIEEFSIRRIGLIVELLFYAIFFFLYFIILLPEKTYDGYSLKLSVQQRLTNGIFLKDVFTALSPEDTITFDSLDEKIGTCSSNGYYNWSKVKCLRTRTKWDYSMISSLDDFELWMDFVIKNSSLFAAGDTDRCKIHGDCLPYVYGESHLVGGVRLRQIKQMLPRPKDVYWYTVNTAPIVGEFSKQVYKYSTPEESTDILQKYIPSCVKSSCGKTPGYNYMGKYRGYDYGGYIVDFPAGDRSNATKQWETLKRDRFFDYSSAAVFLSFTLYNPAIDNFIFCQFLVEFYNTGMAVAHFDSRIIRFDQRLSSQVCVYLLIIFCAAFMIYHVMSIRRDIKLTSFTTALNSWHTLDLLCHTFVLISLSLIAYTLDMNEYYLPFIYWDEFCKVGSVLYSTGYDYVSWFYLILSICNSLAVLLCMVIAGKFLAIYQTSNMVNVFQKAMMLLVGFLVLYLFSLFVACSSGVFLFGSTLIGFSTIDKAFNAVNLYLFGSSDQDNRELWEGSIKSFFKPLVSESITLHSVQYAGRVQGFTTNFPMSTFWFFVTIPAFRWLLLNLFGSIIIWAYMETKQEEKIEKDVWEELVHQGINGYTIKSRLSYFLFEAKKLLWYGRENSRIVNKLQTSNEAKLKQYLTYEEFYSLIQDDGLSESTDILAEHYMNAYSVKLGHLEEALIAFKDIEIKHRRLKSPDVRSPLNFPVILSTEDFDPDYKDTWLKSLLTCELLESHVYVLNRQSIELFEEINQLFDNINKDQDILRDEMKLLSQKIRQLTQAPSENQESEYKQGGTNPWNEKHTVTTVEMRADGNYDAHHVSESGVYRYVGNFNSESEAWFTLEEIDNQLNH